MPKLNQVLAIEKSTKNRIESEFTKIHQALTKAELLNGFAKTYSPTEENGETLPPENKKVQFKADEQIRKLKKELSKLFDVTAVKDRTNCVARADVVLENGTILAKDVPATYLLFIEKKLVDIATFVKKLPTLDAGETWAKDDSQGLWATPTAESVRTKKIEDYTIIVPATKEHPAQVAKVTKDVPAGTWRTIKYSGALQAERVSEMLERVEALQKAVKYARAQANMAQTDEGLRPGAALLGYVFGTTDTTTMTRTVTTA